MLVCHPFRIVLLSRLHCDLTDLTHGEEVKMMLMVEAKVMVIVMLADDLGYPRV